MSQCDCSKRLFEEIKDYIKYKIAHLDVKQYLNNQGDVDQLQIQVDDLLRELDQQYKHVIRQLKITSVVDEEAHRQYKGFQDKFEFIEEKSIQDVDDSVKAIEETKAILGQIDTYSISLTELLKKTNVDPKKFQNECLIRLEMLNKMEQESSARINKMQGVLQKYQHEHQQLESSILQLFKK